MASAVRPSQTQYDYADYVPADQALCPICELACVSLQQLNQHIDDAHTEEESKNILVSWFRNTQKRVLSNKSPLSAATGSSANTITKSFSSLVDQNLLSNFNNLTLSNVVGGTTLNSFTPEQERAMELVTNKHWQRETGQDICTHPGCGKALGSVLGKIGVGKQHCMKLSANERISTVPYGPTLIWHAFFHLHHSKDVAVYIATHTANCRCACPHQRNTIPRMAFGVGHASLVMA
ncbi:hypothetical protein BC938DRAFT_471625 [Jimgerdemannia flammicorona]|uniref:C2H2-type domain-containing protein n=1 Tax=Jimgerdemannia flammicorona TaxID=994334 RepID=A0A433QUH5_9FUNG|nr:hypothetical protein BC938DRAFT_471625 [Jimgerdemannia flammicorona]